MMTNKGMIWGAAALMTVGCFAPIAAHADDASRQKNKNLWRNLAYGAAAVTGYGLLKHDNTMAALGAAGTAYAANRYEQDRHHQSQENALRQRVSREWYSRHPRYYHTRASYAAPAHYVRSYQGHVPHGHAWGWHRHHDND